MAVARVRRLAKRTFGRLVWRETYRCLRLPWDQAQSAAAAVDEAAEPLEVRPLARSELVRYGREGGYDFSPQFLQGIASRDDLCVAAFAGGKLVSYCFFATGATPIDSYLRFRFPLRWVYVYKAFTHPAWRGRRLQQQLFFRALPDVERWLHGPERPLGFVTLVVADNAPSLSAFSRLGFRPFESFPVLRIRSRPGLISPPEEQRMQFYIEAT